MKKKLAELKPLEKGRMIMIQGGSYFHRHLQDMGLKFGSIIQVISTTTATEPDLTAPEYSEQGKEYVISFSNVHSGRVITVLSEHEAEQIYVKTGI